MIGPPPIPPGVVVVVMTPGLVVVIGMAGDVVVGVVEEGVVGEGGLAVLGVTEVVVLCPDGVVAVDEDPGSTRTSQ